MQEEGIVVKAANSPWRCNDRGNVWLKIKPDYLQVSKLYVLQWEIAPAPGHAGYTAHSGYPAPGA